MKPIITNDPYRNNQPTTLAQFALAENAKHDAVKHYFWLHRTLKGFRTRPPKYCNGITPHTFTYNGNFISSTNATKISGLKYHVLKYFLKKGIPEITEIKKAYTIEQSKKHKARLVETDFGAMSLRDFAQSNDVTLNTVYLFYRRYGTLRGFAARGYSRIHQRIYTDEVLNISHTIKEWAKYYSVSIKAIKSWLKNHNHNITGYGTRFKTYSNGKKKATVKEWANFYGVSPQRIRHFLFAHNLSLKGFDPTRKRGRYP